MSLNEIPDISYFKKKRNKKDTKDNVFYQIPGFSNYEINKNGQFADKSTGKLYGKTVDEKHMTYYLRDDKGHIVPVEIPYLLSQMGYGANNFPLLPLPTEDFTSEDVKVDIIEALKSFTYISHEEFSMCGATFRQYMDTPLYISQYGNVFNAATGMLLKIPQHNGYYTMTNYYGNLRIQRLVYETWRDELPDNLVIDHINCRPWDNTYTNLDAVDMKENSRRAIRNSCKERNLKWEKAVEICRDLAFPDPISPQVVSLKYDIPVHITHQIISRRSWVDLSDEYGFVYPDYNLKKKTEITPEMKGDVQRGMSMGDFGVKYLLGGRKLYHIYNVASRS